MAPRARAAGPVEPAGALDPPRPMTAARPAVPQIPRPAAVAALLLVAAGTAISRSGAPDAGPLALLALLGAAFVGWLAIPIPYGVTGLLLLVATDVLGLSGGISPYTGFGESAFFFLLGILFIAAAVEETGTAKRLSRRFLHDGARLSSLDLRWRVPLLLLASSAVVSSATARAGLLRPISRSLFGVGQASRTREAKYLTLYVGNVSPLTSRAFLSGGPGVVVAADLMAREGYALSWMEWVGWLGVPVALMVAASTVCHWLWIRPGPIQGPATAREPLRPVDRRVFAVVGATIALWVAGPAVGVGATAAALLGAVLLAPLVGLRGARRVDLDLVLFSGATLSFGYVLIESGTADWLGSAFAGGMRWGAGSAALVPAVFLLLVLLRIPLNSGVSYSAVVFPIILQMEPVAGILPLHLAFMALVTGAMAFLPVQSPPAMISFSLQHYTLREGVASGVLITASSALVFQFFAIPYWTWLASVAH